VTDRQPDRQTYAGDSIIPRESFRGDTIRTTTNIVKVIWHKATLSLHMNNSVIFTTHCQYAPHILPGTRFLRPIWVPPQMASRTQFSHVFSAYHCAQTTKHVTCSNRLHLCNAAHRCSPGTTAGGKFVTTVYVKLQTHKLVYIMWFSGYCVGSCSFQTCRHNAAQ